MNKKAEKILGLYIMLDYMSRKLYNKHFEDLLNEDREKALKVIESVLPEPTAEKILNYLS